MGIKKAIKNRTGFLFMLVILVILGIIILLYREKFTVLYKYGYNSVKNFVDNKIVKNKELKKQGEKINRLVKKEKEKIEDNIKEKIKDRVDDAREKVNDKLAEKTKEILKTDKEKSEAKKELAKKTEGEDSAEKDSSKEKIKKKEEESKDRSFQAAIYLSKITEDEKIELVRVKRTIKYMDAPLTETLKILIQGPNTTERSNDLLSSIPTKTKLISVYIKNNTAFINLSQEFEYNPYGREAALAQVKQIVFTTTEFSSVKNVQLLIEGKIKTYLGGEGIIINKPLTRNDLT